METKAYDYTDPDPSLKLVIDQAGPTSFLLEAVERFMILRGTDFVFVRVNTPHVVDDLIKAGFMPNYIADNTKKIFQFDTWMLIDHYIDGFSSDAISFWFNEHETIESAIGARDNGHYFYANIKGWIEFAIRTGNSFPLLMYAKDRVYRSRRPKTDMLMFRQATSGLYTQVEPESPYTMIVTGDGFKIRGLPVTRYAAGMSKGLYYNDDLNKSKVASQFCGTFYYYEPESTTLLTFNSYIVFKNKHDAVKGLIDGQTRIHFTDHLVDKYYNALERSRPFAHPDLMMTPTEYMETKYESALAEFDEPFWLRIDQRKHYVGRHLELYAVEDVYDQEICKAAREAGYDVVILTQMVGAFQLVTEILDTRDRQVSFNSLVFPASR